MSIIATSLAAMRDMVAAAEEAGWDCEPGNDATLNKARDALAALNGALTPDLSASLPPYVEPPYVEVPPAIATLLAALRNFITDTGLSYTDSLNVARIAWTDVVGAQPVASRDQVPA